MKKLLSIMLTVLMLVTMIPFTPVAFAVDDYAVVNTEAGTVTIDGTLGGKTTATEDDVNTLVEQLKGYVDSGITTIIVTGSEPALHNFYGIDTSAVSAALYYLANNNPDSPYCGTIDLILPDVTEIVDDEFNNTFALNSITLPKVTKLGDLAFYAAQYLQTITFGSVLTEVNETGGVMFYYVGKKVGGCDLVLNCGQMDSTYIPDIENNTWTFRYENEFKSITLGTHVSGEDGTCDCGIHITAKVEDKDDITTYYATLADALAAAQVATDPYGMQANVYALADCNDDFTVPDSVDFYGRSYSFGGNVTNNGDIREGTFTGNVTNKGDIEEGTFNGEVTNEKFIHGGTFNGTVINHDSIYGGTFNGNVTNYNIIHNDFDEYSYTLGDDFTIENNGDIYCDYHFWKNGQCRLCAYACAHAGGEATCTAKAVCETCGEEYGDIDKDNHNGKTVTVEAQAKTCTEIGWEAYEYCTECDYTTYKEIPASHEIKTVDKKDATCTETGHEAYEYCTECDYTTYVEIPAEHTPLEAVKENEVASKCGVAGSYDLVVYCDVCGEELNRDTTTVDALTHTDADGDYLCDNGCGHEFEKPVTPEEPTPDTPDEPETPDEPTEDVCEDCGKVHTNFFSEIICFFAKIINFIKNLFA